jgi:hypothetical protein
MRGLLVACVSLTILAGASHADAADLSDALPSKAPPHAAAYDWTGFYVGGHLSYALGSSHWSSTQAGVAGAFLSARSRQMCCLMQSIQNPPFLSYGALCRGLLSVRTSLRRCRSLFPGNGILLGGDGCVKKARHIQPIVNRDKIPARKPANSALFARYREISVCMGLRGGAGRTRTSNQTIISRVL